MNLKRACLVSAIGTAFACGAPGQQAKKSQSGAITDHVPTEWAEPQPADEPRPAAPARSAKAAERKAKRAARRAKAKAAGQGSAAAPSQRPVETNATESPAKARP